LLAIVDPEDEVIVFEPFYENYGPDATLCGARPVFVPLRPPDFTFDRDQLAAAFSPHTKAIVVNTPNNPTGRVFTPDELEAIAAEFRIGLDRLYRGLEPGAFRPRLPEGAYYLLCDVSHLGFDDDVVFARWLVERVGVAGVPGSAFFSRPELGRGLIRFTFCKQPETLDVAAARLAEVPRIAHQM